MNIIEIIHSQYWAALEMFRIAIDQCPESLWDDQSYDNRFWQVAYHTLFFAHLYLQQNEDAFAPWEQSRSGADGWAKTVDPYTKGEMLAYLDFCEEEVEKQLFLLELEAPPGFDWFDKVRNTLEVQLYNIRHIQHHAGELYERLGPVIDDEHSWVGAKPTWS